MNLDEAQAAVYRLANPQVEYNAGAAITKAWLRLKLDGSLIGVPIGPEMPLEDGRVAQGFTSGALLVWSGGDDVELV